MLVKEKRITLAKTLYMQGCMDKYMRACEWMDAWMDVRRDV